jgi:hypothetical protein
MQINIEFTEQELRNLILNHLEELLGRVALNPEDVKIQVKSKQNYKSEWEEAAFRATVNKQQ